MFMSRRTLLSILGASVVSAAFGGVVSAKGGGGRGGGGRGSGRDGAMDTGPGIVPSAVSGTNPMQVRTFRIFEGKRCRGDYARLCPMKPMGKCDLESKIDQLSSRCRVLVEKHR